MTIFKKLVSREGRKAIYALAATVLGIAFVLGWIDADSQTLILDQVAKGIAALVPILALFNLTPPDGEVAEVTD